MQATNIMHTHKNLMSWAALSISSSVLCLLFVLLHDHLSSALQRQIQEQMTLQPGTQMLSHWIRPPLEPELRVYIYNVTNAQRFLSGEDPQIHVNEVGPFVYRSRVMKNVTSHGEETISFTSSSFYTFVQEKSIGHHDDIRLTVPNVIILSALMKKESREAMPMIKSGFIWPFLASFPTSELFLDLSVNEYLWGYEEDLACMDSLTEEDEHDELFKSAFTKEEEKVSRFWDVETGTCRFGIISQNNNTVSKEMTIDSGASSMYSKCRVELEEGRFSLKTRPPQDTYDPSCPPSPESNPQHKFGIMIDFFCRDIRMELDKGGAPLGKRNSLIKRERYIPTKSTFEEPISIESCSEGVPFFISQPRFFGSNFSYEDQIKGIPQGDKEHHQLYMDLERTYGGILGLQMRFQLNLKLTRDLDFKVISNLAQKETMLPLIWLQEGYEKLPSLQMVSLHVGLYIPAVLPKGLALLFGCLSIIFSSILLHRLRMNSREKKSETEFECRYFQVSDSQKYI